MRVPSRAGCAVSQQGWTGCWGSPSGWIYGFAGILGNTRQSRAELQEEGACACDWSHYLSPDGTSLSDPQWLSACLEISFLTWIGSLWTCWHTYLPIGVGTTYGCLLTVQMDGELPRPLRGCRVDLWGTQSFMHSQDKWEGNKCLGNWPGGCSWLNQWQREHLHKSLHYNTFKHSQIMVVLTSKEH